MRLAWLRGGEIRERWEELGRLRIAVFREFPYLYEGSLDYEEGYLEPYWRSPHSLVVLLEDEGRVVGASTGLPLVDEHPDLRRAFSDPGEHFYLGESLLLPRYRGLGFGHRFFAEREAHALELGYRVAGFYAVERAPDHPRRPAEYRALDAFWRRRGYERRPERDTTFCWRDLDEEEESPKPMQFWSRDLSPGQDQGPRLA